MQRNLDKLRRSEEEAVKDAGLTLDYDEMARKGAMSREEASISKWYGIYKSRQAGDHMARIVVPGGQVSSVDARAMAAIGKEFGPDRLSFTTRQAVQVHKLQLDRLGPFLRAVKDAGISTFHGCGDVTRNVTACSWAAICPHRRLDVLPYVKEVAKELTACRDLDNLPRKYKLNFSGCGAGCGQPDINCVGIDAVQRAGSDGKPEVGFRVRIGGGLGWKPFISQLLYTFVPTEQIVGVSRAIGILFRDHGDRHIRKFARLKFVVARKGIEKCRELIDAILDDEGIDRSSISSAPFKETGSKAPDRPLREPLPQDIEENAIVRVMIPKGELPCDAVTRLAELSELYADKYIYNTNRQNVELHGVRMDQRKTLKAEIAKLGLLTEGFHGLLDVVTCVGTTYCPLAVTSTHALFDALQHVVHEEKYALIRDKAIINISGCPNSCSQYRCSDIGFRGMRIREQEGAVEAYQVMVGGELDRFNDLVGEYKAEDCPRVTRAILDAFMASRDDAPEGETLARHVARIGFAPYVKAVQALSITYDIAPKPREYSVDSGKANLSLDAKTIAKDVPCQEACPASTAIPEYIQMIAQGNLAKAHLINQECNVLPGVLGRVCTRPCEVDCRHNWTNINGPVSICHLKRRAADGKAGASKPLPAYFDASGKSIAIIGGGPAGLAAARELKRYGHAVTIYDRAPYLGGQIRSGIPAFRLPRKELSEDIDAIINSGVEVKFGEDINAARIEEFAQSYDAVLVVTGATVPRSLKLDGLDSSLAIEGLEFMRRFNDEESIDIKGNVLVIGGGFTSVDCSRSARRLLGPDVDVTIMYRRGKAEMAANTEEFHEMEQEKIGIETLVTPVSAEVCDGKLQSVTFRRNVLGEAEADGRASFIPVEGSEFSKPCDTLIFAIGQTPDTSILPEGVTLEFGHTTSRDYLFVAGDFSMGNGDVIHAVADGKTVADEIDLWLMGEIRREEFLQISTITETGRVRDHDLLDTPKMPILPLSKRGATDEVELGFGAEDGEEHAWRCYLCNHKFEIDQDKCIHCDWCIRVSPRECIRRLSHLETDADGAPVSWKEVPANEPEKATYIWIDSDNCIRCGNCYNICPTDAITLRKVECKSGNCASGAK